MIIFVFSYNRGPLLKNCVESIEQCAPGHRVVIYDDASDDLETQHILAEIGKTHEVLTRDDKDSKDQHGALYKNMQRAIDSVAEDSDELLFFMQDDAQLIRPIEKEDIEFFTWYFSSFPKAGFLAPVFQKRITRQRTLDRFVYNSERKVYVCQHRSRIEVAGVYYSDISITTRSRLKSVGWTFFAGEYENEKQAREQFIEMGYLYAPVAMHLPNPPAYRNKKKRLAFSIAENLNKAGLYPFNIMPPQEVARLKSRPQDQVPIAEDFLTIKGNDNLRQPWIFHPLRRSRVLRSMDKLESWFRRLVGRV